MSITLTDLSRETKIILYCLPSHTTHILQSMYILVEILNPYFSTITGYVALANFTIKKTLTICKTNLKVVSQPEFEKKKTVMISAIKSVFKAFGIYPFNLKVITKCWIIPSETNLTNSITLPEALDFQKTINTSAQSTLTTRVTELLQLQLLFQILLPIIQLLVQAPLQNFMR